MPPRRSRRPPKRGSAPTALAAGAAAAVATADAAAAEEASSGCEGGCERGDVATAPPGGSAQASRAAATRCSWTMITGSMRTARRSTLSCEVAHARSSRRCRRRPAWRRRCWEGKIDKAMLQRRSGDVHTTCGTVSRRRIPDVRRERATRPGPARPSCCRACAGRSRGSVVQMSGACREREGDAGEAPVPDSVDRASGCGRAARRSASTRHTLPASCEADEPDARRADARRTGRRRRAHMPLELARSAASSRSVR